MNATKRAIRRAKAQERDRLEIERLRTANGKPSRRVRAVPSDPNALKLTTILTNEAAHNCDDRFALRSLKTLAMDLAKYEPNSPVSLLRYYSSLTVDDRKALAVIAVKQLKGEGVKPIDMPWLTTFRRRIGAQDPNLILLSTPGDISAEDQKRM